MSTVGNISEKKKALKLSLLVALSPLLPLILAQLMSALFGCGITEAAEPKCVRLGIDFGGFIYLLFMLGVGGLGISIWLGLGIYEYRRPPVVSIVLN